jgi:hypothetical protein
MKEFDDKVKVLIDSIVNAAKVIHEKPKAEDYIRRKIADIYHVGKEVGKISLTNEIFNGSH